MTLTAGERGSAALELAFFTPVLLMLVMLVVFAGRISNTKNAVVSTANDAARAASIRDNPLDASRAATATARVALDGRSVTCASPRVDTDTSQLHPGGTVRVTVTCVASLADLTLLAVPGSTTISATATEPIDRYRSTP